MLAAFEAVLSTDMATTPVPIGGKMVGKKGGGREVVPTRKVTQKKRRKPDNYIDWFSKIE
jgi:hypothetical protein